MVTHEEIRRIKNMSFRELRNELAYCDNNPVKELLIRNLMKEKYIHCMRKKKKIEEHQKMEKRLKYKKLKNIMARKYDHKYRKYYIESKDSSIESIMDDIEDVEDVEDIADNIPLREEDFNLYPNHGPLNELEENNGLYDKKFKDEVNKDFMNNNLMDRMNSEIDIRNIKLKNKKDFIPPFADNDGGMYAPFHNQTNIPTTDFSTKRILRDRG